MDPETNPALPPPKQKLLSFSGGNPKRKKWLLITFLCIALVALLLFIYWFFWWRFEEYTDDAYVGGNMVLLTPQVGGIVSKIYTDDNLLVQQGQLLVRLDPTDATLMLEKRKAELGEQVREVVTLFKRVEEMEAQVFVREGELRRAELDFMHREKLVAMGAVSREDFEHAEIALAVAFAELRFSQCQLAAAQAQVFGITVATHPLVEEAKRAFRQAYVDLKRCSLYSPATGIVSQRVAQVGKQVEIGQRLLDIIPLNEIWIDANFKEVQLKNIRLGQRAKVTVDMYGDSHIFHGKVQGFSPGTGSAFSLLPPQNATGNWIKIVQRVSVRITLDPEEVCHHPLWLGLSAEVTVDLHDKSGLFVPHLQPVQLYYETDVYEQQQEGVEPLIEEVIRSNVG